MSRRALMQYAPAIVLGVWTVLATLGAGLTAIGLGLMAVAVVAHVRAETHHDG
jgi:hypothetical protein